MNQHQETFKIYTRLCSRCNSFFKTKRRKSRGRSNVCYECAINKWRSRAIPKEAKEVYIKHGR